MKKVILLSLCIILPICLSISAVFYFYFNANNANNPPKISYNIIKPSIDASQLILPMPSSEIINSESYVQKPPSEVTESYSKYDGTLPGDVKVSFYAGKAETKVVNGVNVVANIPTDANLASIVNKAINEATQSIANGHYAEFKTLCIGNIVSITAISSPNLSSSSLDSSSLLNQNNEVISYKYLTYSKSGNRLNLSNVLSKSDLSLAIDIPESASVPGMTDLYQNTPGYNDIYNEYLDQYYFTQNDVNKFASTQDFAFQITVTGSKFNQLNLLLPEANTIHLYNLTNLTKTAIFSKIRF